MVADFSAAGAKGGRHGPNGPMVNTLVMVKQQALRAGNYVRVIEISGASRVLHNSVVPPVPLLSEIWGHVPPPAL